MYLAALVQQGMDRSSFEMRRLTGCMQLIKRAQLYAYISNHAKIPALQANLAKALASYMQVPSGIAPL